jgi:hypothetical protein
MAQLPDGQHLWSKFLHFDRMTARTMADECCRPEDAAIMFCEGAFPLMETDEKNYAILTHTRAALRPRSRLLLTTLNTVLLSSR